MSDSESSASSEVRDIIGLDYIIIMIRCEIAKENETWNISEITMYEE